MALEQALLTWVHITSAAIWVGGSLFIGVVFAPILKKCQCLLKKEFN